MQNFNRFVVTALWSGGALALGAPPSAATGAAAPKVPAQMQAVFAEAVAGGPAALSLRTVDVPAPTANQVLVEVYAAGADPVDWNIRARDKPATPPTGILGREISGVVVKLGSDVKDYKNGDKVIVALACCSGYAQYAVADVADMAPKPKQLTFEEAAGIPVVGFTAMRMVVVGELRKYQRVLVIGAAGGVGSAAVQLAKEVGAHVIADASSQHHAYLKSLGADEIIDYDKENVGDRAKNLDAVFNTVGSENANALTYLRRGGVLMTAAGTVDMAACATADVTCARMGRQGISNGDALKRISVIADEGKFTIKVEKSFPLAKTADAFDFGLSGNREGKVIIDVRKDARRK